MPECPNCGNYNVRCYDESYPEASMVCKDCHYDWIVNSDDDEEDYDAAPY